MTSSLNRTHCARLLQVVGGLLGLLLLGAALESSKAPSAAASREAGLVVGPRRCAECHEQENRTWLETAHHQGFKTLARRPEARAMSKALGIRRLKTEERCVRCHFTEQMDEENESKVIAGVSCESCHGAGEKWLDLHGDYGGEAKTRQTEDPVHREERLAACFDLGMRGPANLYELAARCYDCHLIVDAELHGAGHGIGGGFELVNALQGEVRHNFVRGEGTNVVAPVERQRVLYLLGCLLEAQFTLTALGSLEGESDLAKAAAGRARVARARLIEAAELIQLPPFEELLLLLPAEEDLTAGNTKLRVGAQAAEKIARWLSLESDQAQFAPLDALVRKVTAGMNR